MPLHNQPSRYNQRAATVFLPLLLILLPTSCSTPGSSTPTAPAPTYQATAQQNQATVAAHPPTAVAQPTSASAQTTATPRPSSSPTTTPTPTLPTFSYPIGVAGRPLGDGFFIRHGVAVENTWYHPGWWHTGEDWYALDGDTAGANIYAVADGVVVYADANYPGRVVIVQHTDNLYSMYGHLDPALAVRVGQHIQRGEVLGKVLRRGDAVPNHLHFEMRNFLLDSRVNGDAPRYSYRCGVQCPPGPGYWPIDAPDLPTAVGWHNPTHVIAQRALHPGSLSEVIVATHPVSTTIALWSAPPKEPTAHELETVPLQPGQRFTLLETRAGPEDTPVTSAHAYELWYHIQLPNQQHGWVQAAVPSTFETGEDGRPASIFFNLFPAIATSP